MKITATITAVGKYLPEDVLSNKDFEKMFDTTDEWITTRTGISERRILKDPNKATSYMMAEACRRVLEQRKIKAEEIDLIVACTVTPDMFFPSTACLVQNEIGAKKAFAFDLSAACSGFLYGLTTGAQFIESGKCKKVLVVGGDKMSSIVDYTDRTTAILFGDGAGAVLLEPTTDGTGILDSILYSDGSGKDYLYMKGGGSLHPPTHKTVDSKMHYLFQDGKTVFKSAVTGMADVSAEILEKNGLKGSDVAYLIPHQANLRIIDATANRMGIDNSKVIINIGKYGNTTAATIPLALCDAIEQSKIRRGDNIILAAFGAGYTWGAIWLKWAYNT
ncbi:MAG: ketoacyl-ACP synthase III [Bacteroidetes bacterium]|nr:ketoacyl-ACP synthase III [Bacteroidota bacterium]